MTYDDFRFLVERNHPAARQLLRELLAVYDAARHLRGSNKSLDAALDSLTIALRDL